MRKITGVLVLLLLPFMALADDSAPEMVLDKVQFQLSAREWVTTQTALLTVSVNVTLGSADLVKARAEINANLRKIVDGDWHILAFDRSQDSSGLEKLSVNAQVRVDQSALTPVYKQVKAVSIPGAQYEVSSIEFKPGLEEIQAVRAKVRTQLYQQVNDELARMNKAYPEQHYSLSSLSFVEGSDVMPQPKARAYETMQLNAAAMAPAPVTVSNELILTALVEAASIRKEGN